MACAYPFQIYNRPMVAFNSAVNFGITDVPCGWCLNCRKDRQNALVDRAEYEYKTRLCGAFVTFTYDQYHLLEKCCVKDGDGRLIFEKDDTVRATLVYKDIKNYIHHLRDYIKAHKEIQGVLCQPDFSYMYVGEYGDCFKRPHFHVLFFGLDFAYCEKLLFEKWTKGFIDVLPILDGGIRYVTKYLDKQLHGVLAKQAYDDKGLARPKLNVSQNFGKGLLLDNLQDICEHDFTYRCGRGLRRPVSQYWKSLITGGEYKRDKTLKRKHIAESLNEINRRRREENKSAIPFDPCSNKSLINAQKLASEYAVQKAKIREYNMQVCLRASGTPLAIPDEVITSRFGRISYDGRKLRGLPDDVKHWLANDYIERLLYGDEVPF